MDVDDLARRLREALVAAEFDLETVSDVLGVRGMAALSRNESGAGLLATSRGTPVETLTRLFLLQSQVEAGALEAALPGLREPLEQAGFIATDGRHVKALLDVRPYSAEFGEAEEHLWVVSDLTPGLDGRPQSVSENYVLGISPASTSLAQLTLRAKADRALDLGTGCGVQALHLAQHCAAVVATDVNPRALWAARFNAVLNNVADAIDVREGSLFAPVMGERFDLIATNPPFVISPATSQRLVYRDSGLPGDQVVEQIVRSAPGLLSDGGWCQVLANWAIHRDQPWAERLASWVEPADDLFVVQREVMDPAAYVELWLKDSGHHGAPDYPARYDAWLRWLDQQGIEGIGFGWINLRHHHSGAQGRHELLEWPYDVEQPIAPAIAEWACALDALDASEPLAVRHLFARADVVQETQGRPGAEDPATIVLRQQRGLRRARQVDTIEAALVGACDGELSIGQILAALAQLTGEQPEELAARYLPIVEELVREGYLASAP